MWLMKLLSRLQPFVVLALFIAFLLIFGIPAFNKYTTYEVYIKETVVDYVEGLNSPAMTICVEMGVAFHATREVIASWEGDWVPFLEQEDLCNRTIDSVDKFYNCLGGLMYSRDQLILESVYYSYSTSIVSTATNASWEERIETGVHGRCQTIKNVGILPASENFKAILNTSLDLGAPYKVWLHDPDFYVESINPSSIPRIDITLNLTGGGHGSFQYIRAEKHVLLQNCRNYTEDGTSFSECVAISAMNSTGCKLRWEYHEAKKNFPDCNDTDSINSQLMFELKIMGKSLEDIIKLTGCQKPCSFYKYVEAQDNTFIVDNTPGQGIMFGYSSNSLTFKEETLLYPFESFVAEIGGLLGLFLGFSFLTLWEIILVLPKVFLNHFGKYTH